MALINLDQIQSHVGRTESFGYYADHSNFSMMEKRQLFLRSYQFCRKRNLAEKIKSSLVKVRRVIRLRLRPALRLRKLVSSRLRHGLYSRRRRFIRLQHHSDSISCFC